MIEKVCSKCGCTWSKFANSGLFGCPYCYQEFERELLPTLKRLQRQTVHNGGKPKTSGVDKQLIAEYNRLMAEKEVAVMTGEFSRIKELSKELSAIIEELKGRGII